MKQIEIKSLQLRNFKGAVNFAVPFTKETTLKGDNGTGKTTVFDAFNWLLWGKNSANESAFEIKAIELSGKHIHNLEHEVTGVISVDGVEMELKRIYREKWVKKKGNEEKEMTGHETDLFINDVPLSLSEYKLAINDILSDEIARLVTDPMYFNIFLPWQKRREILTQIAGEISDEDILILNPELDEISDILKSGKTLVNKKAETSAKKLKINAELKQIPARLDEVDRNKPEPKDWTSIENGISELETKKTDLENKISSVQEQINAEFESQRAILERKNKLKIDIATELNNCTITANKQRNDAINVKTETETKISQAESIEKQWSAKLKANNVSITDLRKANDSLKEQYNEENAKQPNLSINDKCNSCDQELPKFRLEAEFESLQAKFNTEKAEKLESLKQKAVTNNAEIQRLQAENSQIETKIKDSKDLVARLTAQLDKIIVPEQTEVIESEQLKALRAELATLEALKEENSTLSTDESKEALKMLIESIDKLKSELALKGLIAAVEKRTDELKTEQLTMSQEIANLERTEMQIDKFIKIRMETVENRVNDKFELVKFKMFDTQLNGGESPTCVCTIDGVPFSDLNTGKKINAGLDIVRTLQNEFEVNAPVFIDNRESVTEIIKMDCQLINLVVVKGLENLQII